LIRLIISGDKYKLLSSPLSNILSHTSSDINNQHLHVSSSLTLCFTLTHFCFPLASFYLSSSGVVIFLPSAFCTAALQVLVSLKALWSVSTWVPNLFSTVRQLFTNSGPISSRHTLTATSCKLSAGRSGGYLPEPTLTFSLLSISVSL
jgi:hypothetical protein